MNFNKLNHETKEIIYNILVLRRTLGYKPFNFGFCSGIGRNSRKRIDKMNKKEKVKSFEDACAVLGIEPKLPDVSGLVEKHQKAIIAFYKLSVIVQALNEGWEPDFESVSQKKYYNHFVVGGSAYSNKYAGFASSPSYGFVSGVDVSLGSLLCFKRKKLAEYARDQFIDLYRDYLLFT